MNIIVLNRKPIFDAVRHLLGRGFSRAEVDAIDRAIDRSLNRDDAAAKKPRLGGLSERFESGGRGPGAVSSGKGDPGGVSYGTYQLASRTGTVGTFLANEGAPWGVEFGNLRPGTEEFSAKWREIASRDPDRFADAQHDFIRRTHYLPVVTAILTQTGFDLDSRHQAVRDAVWSVAVQHGGATRILKSAVSQMDEVLTRDHPAYDRRLVKAIYAQRSAYVLRVAGRSGPAARNTLESITRTRYPEELKTALAMFDAGQSMANAEWGLPNRA